MAGTPERSSREDVATARKALSDHTIFTLAGSERVYLNVVPRLGGAAHHEGSVGHPVARDAQ